MTDDWSLKGKAIDLTDVVGMAFAVDTKDIETLRQKLIEDMEELIKKYPISLAESWEIIINRRFGHD